MILYLAGNAAVSDPGGIRSGRTMDLGPGLYLATDMERAALLAALFCRRRGGEPVVSVFEVDDGMFGRHPSLVFRAPDVDWLRFVVANRSGRGVGGYGIVMGPAADDDAYAAIVLHEAGLLSEEEALARPGAMELSDWVVLSGDAVSELRFREAVALG